MDQEVWHTTPPYDDGGDVGGDWQVGPARNVRWWRELPDDERFAPGFEVVDRYIYLETADVFPNGDPERYIVTEQECSCFCTDKDDPGGTERWSDYHYDHSELDYSLAVAARLRDESFRHYSNDANPSGI